MYRIESSVKYSVKTFHPRAAKPHSKQVNVSVSSRLTSDGVEAHSAEAQRAAAGCPNPLAPAAVDAAAAAADAGAAENCLTDPREVNAPDSAGASSNASGYRSRVNKRHWAWDTSLASAEKWSIARIPLAATAINADGEIECSVEETNRIRSALGLSKLR